MTIGSGDFRLRVCIDDAVRPREEWLSHCPCLDVQLGVGPERNIGLKYVGDGSYDSGVSRLPPSGGLPKATRSAGGFLLR